MDYVNFYTDILEENDSCKIHDLHYKAINETSKIRLAKDYKDDVLFLIKLITNLIKDDSNNQTVNNFAKELHELLYKYNLHQSGPTA